MSWRDDAECKGTPTEVFFPDLPVGRAARKGTRIERERQAYAPAKAICDACPVIDHCREENAGRRYGMWFGTTPRERGYSKRGDYRARESA